MPSLWQHFSFLIVTGKEAGMEGRGEEVLLGPLGLGSRQDWGRSGWATGL